MKLYVSHGANPDDWFIVAPCEGETTISIVGTEITPEMARQSLIDAGRTVYELDVVPMASGLYKLVAESSCTCGTHTHGGLPPHRYDDIDCPIHGVQK